MEFRDSDIPWPILYRLTVDKIRLIKAIFIFK